MDGLLGGGGAKVMLAPFQINGGGGYVNIVCK